MEIRATTQLRNNTMMAARKAKGWSQKDVARKAKVPFYRYRNLERLRYEGFKHVKGEHLQRISKVLKIPIEDIAPSELLGIDFPSDFVQVKQVEGRHLLAYMTREKDRLSLPEPGKEMEVMEEYEIVSNLMKNLPHKRQQALKLRFGLEGERPHTFEEIGQIFHTTRQYAQDAEVDTLNKLRHLLKQEANRKDQK